MFVFWLVAFRLLAFPLPYDVGLEPPHKLHFDPFPSHLSLLGVETFLNKPTTFQQHHLFRISVPSAPQHHHHSSTEITEFLATTVPLSRVNRKVQPKKNHRERAKKIKKNTMSHSYASEYPAGIDFDPAYKQFFEDFYAVSDTPGEHEKYADNFTEDATLIMASKTVKGRAEIIGLRHAMWEKVSSRQHAPLKIFPAGAKGADEVMLYGTVAYTFKDGRQGSVDWAARANLVKEDGRVKMRYYQVYLDTAAMQAAK